MAVTLQFLGGVGTVTGSKTVVESGDSRVLIDCGLFQGLKELRLRNWNSFPIDPNVIDAVVLTHAHLDHVGYLPVLARLGFSGPVYCTGPTREIAKIILMDAARIQEEDADYANRMGFSKHSPAKPLFNQEEARAAFQKLQVVNPGEWFDPAPGMRARLTPSSHILGSAFIELDCENTRLVFSGDLGRSKPLLYPEAQKLERADVLIVESTYGDRLHSEVPVADALAKVVNEALDRDGHLLIPSFAVGRTQELLLLLHRLKAGSRIPAVPIYLDSPMGMSATEALLGNPDWHTLSESEVQAIERDTVMVKSVQQSQDVMRLRNPAIVIAGSGMVTGGRILHHLANRLGDTRNTVLLAGYQAAGTRGRQLVDGASEVKIHGQFYPVRARIEKLDGLSAHADQREILQWLKQFTPPPKKIIVNHGEPQAAHCLRVKIRSELGIEPLVPGYLERVRLD